MTIEERIANLDDAELDDFALGVARLDRDGTVLFFNKAEELFANRRADDTVGLNYFRDVAPCTAVKNFQGRFDTLAAGPPRGCETFSFTYPFWMGDKRVTINLVRRAVDPQYIYIVTEMRNEG